MQSMKRVKSIITITVAVLISYSSYGQIHIDEISLEFTHSLRIPNHEVKIDVIHVLDADTVVIRVQSNPMKNDPNWIHTKIDTSYLITKEEFKTLKDLAYSISVEDIKKAMTGVGTDGTLCRLGYGDFQNKIIYQVWTPDYNTKERGLEKYMEACEMMLKMAGFKPRKIF